MALEDEVRGFLQQHGRAYLEEVGFPWLRIESISTDPSYDSQVREGAQFLASALSALRLNAHIFGAQDLNPIVYAQSELNPEKPTVLIYGHGDVQGVAGQTWNTPPFEPTLIDGKLYGRGTADDKAQVLALMMGVAAAREANGGELPVNVKFLIEHNEENSVGGAFERWVHEHRDRLLSADGVVIADCEQYDNSGAPTFVTSLKGIHAAKIVMNDPDPFRFAQLIASLYNTETCRVNLPGFYDDVVERGPIESMHVLELMAATPAMGEVLTPEARFDHATHRARRPTYDPLTMFFANPSPEGEGHTVKITAHGPKTDLHSGSFGGPVQNPGLYLARAAALLHGSDIDYIRYGDPGSPLGTSIRSQGEMQITFKGLNAGNLPNTLAKYFAIKWGAGDSRLLTFEEIPPDSRRDYLAREPFKDGKFTTPRAGLSFRLVANQDPANVAATLKQIVELSGARIDGEGIDGSPFLADMESPFCRTMIGAAKDYYGKEPLTFEEGGSIPIAIELNKIAPVVLYAFGPEGANLHNANEWVRESDLYQGAGGFAMGLLRLGQR